MGDDVVNAGDRVGDTATKLWGAFKGQLFTVLGEQIVKWDRFAAQLKDTASWLDVVRGKAATMPEIKPPAGYGRPTGVQTPRLSADEVKGIEAELDAERKAHNAAADAAAQHMRQLRDGLFGRNTIRRAQELVTALGPLSNLAQVSAEKQRELNSAMAAAADVYRQHGQVAPQVIRDLYMATLPTIPVVEGLAGAFEHLGEKVKLSVLEIVKWPETAVSGIGNIASKLGERFDSSIMKVTLPHMKKSWGSALTAMLEDSSRFLGSGGGPWNALKNFGTTFAKDFTKQMLSFIPGIGPIISQFAGPIVDGVKKFFGGLFGKGDGRKAVEDFAKSFGGFDALHAKLKTLGDGAGQRRWISLTQGVGKNNPQQAKAIIEEITAALEQQKAKEAEVAAAAEDSAVRQSEAVDAASQKLKDAIAAIDTEMASLQQSVANEAPEEQMGVVEAAARARMASLAEERKRISEELEAQQADVKDSVETVGDSVVDLGDQLGENVGQWETWARRVKAAIDGSGAGRFGVPGPGEPVAAHASGAYIRQDHVAAVHAGELVGPLDFMTRALAGAMRLVGGGGGGSDLAVAPVYLDGQKVGDILVRRIGPAVQRFGVGRA